MPKPHTIRNQTEHATGVEELSDYDLDLVVGGVATHVAADLLDEAQPRRPRFDGVVILHSSLPGGGS
jgi:hypothetical protein